MNPDVQPADSGELQLAAITLGIPHPPGYPLFTLLGWLFAQVPIGSPFARVTFLSVVASAGCVALVAACVLGIRDWGLVNNKIPNPQSPIPFLSALLAALALATSTTFWAQATTTNIRSLTAFFTALIVFALIRFKLNAQRSWFILFALALGLGVGHHVSLVFMGAVFGVFVLGMAIRARLPLKDFILAGLALLATQLVWLYLPLRNSAAGLLDHGDLSTLQGFLDHVLARGFEGDLFYFIRAKPHLFWDRLALTPTLLQFQFSPPVLVLMALAATITVWRERALGLTLLTAFTLHLFITLTYRAPQTVEYALPCWVIACVVLGLGISAFTNPQPFDKLRKQSLIPRLSSLLRFSVFIALTALVARDALARYPSFVQLSQDRSTRANAQAVLRLASDNDNVFSQWHQATPMWALQAVEHLRPAVRVNYVYPQGAEPYETTFAKRAASAQQGNTYVTSFYESEFAQQRLQSYPLDAVPAWGVFMDAFPPDFGVGFAISSTQWDGRIALQYPLVVPKQVQAGAQFFVDLAWSWRGTLIEGDSITVRILRRDGRLATNADMRLVNTGGLGDFGFKRVVMAIPYDLEPGDYDILAGAYNGATIYKMQEGASFVNVGQLSIINPQSPIPNDKRYIPFANQMALVGSSTHRSGNLLKIDLRWLALQSLTEDYKISVRLRGTNFYQAHDGVPALGAIPTLKWIRGSEITDRHVFDLGNYTGPLEAEVVVYDNVTRLPLLPLDERYPNGVTIGISD